MVVGRHYLCHIFLLLSNEWVLARGFKNHSYFLKCFLLLPLKVPIRVNGNCYACRCCLCESLGHKDWLNQLIPHRKAREFCVTVLIWHIYSYTAINMRLPSFCKRLCDKVKLIVGTVTLLNSPGVLEKDVEHISAVLAFLRSRLQNLPVEFHLRNVEPLCVYSDPPDSVFERWHVYYCPYRNKIIDVFCYWLCDVQGSADPLNSAFHLTYNMVLNLLRVEEINPEYMLEKSFYQFQHYRALPGVVESKSYTALHSSSGWG